MNRSASNLRTGRSPTIDDVAAEAGVSRATVSRSLNGGSVSTATRDRVLATADRLGYRPNHAARSLASGRSGVIGIVLHTAIDHFACDFYGSALYLGMTSALAEQGTVGVMQWFSRGDRDELAELVVSSHFVDGIVATVVDADDVLIPRLVAAEIPTVAVGGHRFADQVGSVDIDDIAGAVTATRHLLQRGARHPGHLTGDPSTTSAQDRLTGFHQALDEAGVSERTVAAGHFDGTDCTEAARHLLDRGVDAVFAGSDNIATFVYTAATERGLRIPEDLLVIGYDDASWAGTMSPPLSSMHQDPRALGTTAANLLQEMLADPERHPRKVTVDAVLVERASTGRHTPREGLSPRTPRSGPR